VTVPPNLEALNRDPPIVDPSTLPPITVHQEVIDFDHTLAGEEMASVALQLAQNLEIENVALLRRDPSILPAVDHGDRLVEMEARVAEAAAGEGTVLSHYDFDALDVSLLVPFGAQTGLSLGFSGTGTLTQETLDGSGALGSSQSTPFSNTFAMRRATGDRWLIVAVLPGP